MVSWCDFNTWLRQVLAFPDAMASPLHGDHLRVMQEAVEDGSGGGYIAAPVDKIEEWTPWEHVEAMIAKWKELAAYPIQV